MPPADVEDNLDRLIQLQPDSEDDLLQRIDQPLNVCKDEKAGKLFIECDYNRDGDNYRSPWTDQYFPPIEDGSGFHPNPELRNLEMKANSLFDTYRHLYFEGGVSSVYMWSMGRGGADFAACFMVKKDVSPGEKKYEGMTGTWNSIHVFSVTAGGMKSEPWEYKLTSTVIVSMAITKPRLGQIDLSGNVSAQKSEKKVHSGSDQDHLTTMGSMIEDMEGTLRNNIENIYIQKTKEIVNGMRINDPFQKSRVDNFASMGKLAAASMRKKKTTE